MRGTNTICPICKEPLLEGEFVYHVTEPINKERPFKYETVTCHESCYRKVITDSDRVRFSKIARKGRGNG